MTRTSGFINISQKWSIILFGLIFVTICVAELCPDHKKSCRRGQTCCDDKQGGFGCCPYENATCCTDGLHCCPEGTSCDLSAGRCRRNKYLKQVELIPSSSVAEESNELVEGSIPFLEMLAGAHHNGKKLCPDRKRSCPEVYTCCHAPEDSYSCCPYANATCCPDKIHCCPHGSKCGSGRCE